MSRREPKRTPAHELLRGEAVEGETVRVEIRLPEDGYREEENSRISVEGPVSYRNEAPSGGGPHTDLDVVVGPKHPKEEGVLVVCERGYDPRAYRVDTARTGIHGGRDYVGRVDSAETLDDETDEEGDDS